MSDLMDAETPSTVDYNKPGCVKGSGREYWDDEYYDLGPSDEETDSASGTKSTIGVNSSRDFSSSLISPGYYFDPSDNSTWTICDYPFCNAFWNAHDKIKAASRNGPFIRLNIGRRLSVLNIEYLRRMSTTRSALDVTVNSKKESADIALEEEHAKTLVKPKILGGKTNANRHLDSSDYRTVDYTLDSEYYDDESAAVVVLSKIYISLYCLILQVNFAH
ncbi:hypothetical protein HELRODRAFT_162373 [Helobdella robusta]|uniref:Uncharacterized protein n=1 Tax=Helobdella robusta TaxID=6412 RepID=T1ESK9_HELRO|nr:hypothetical protein HELRODRAFT_162373 [Helobdella robusta]ESN98906.1 hypothetical protein HELRODRAFT_162373 [Helobdella robusta]